jgi:hypothetical protein
MGIALVVLMLSPALAMAPAPASAGAPRAIFTCEVGAKFVRIEMVGDKLVYRYGLRGKDEIMIVGDRRSGNPLYYSRSAYDFTAEQVRFTNGVYSYVVYAVVAKTSEASPSSGIIVAKGDKKLSDRLCAKPARFTADLSALPQDDDTFDAMAF